MGVPAGARHAPLVPSPLHAGAEQLSLLLPILAVSPGLLRQQVVGEYSPQLGGVHGLGTEPKNDRVGTRRTVILMILQVVLSGSGGDTLLDGSLRKSFSSPEKERCMNRRRHASVGIKKMIVQSLPKRPDVEKRGGASARYRNVLVSLIAGRETFPTT